MTEICRVFAQNLADKMKNVSVNNRETKKCNYDLSARVNVNLSIEEIDFIFYCIEKELEK